MIAARCTAGDVVDSPMAVPLPGIARATARRSECSNAGRLPMAGARNNV
jgi:hypothetical protein